MENGNPGLKKICSGITIHLFLFSIIISEIVLKVSSLPVIVVDIKSVHRGSEWRGDGIKTSVHPFPFKHANRSVSLLVVAVVLEMQ